MSDDSTREPLPRPSGRGSCRGHPERSEGSHIHKNYRRNEILRFAPNDPRGPIRLRRGLLAWYRAEARDLPWRRSRDPYKVWISEIMLQQTRVDQALPYYTRFIKTFARIQDLAAASMDRVLKLWEGLGYYNRARNLYQAARIIVRRWDGRFPRSAAEWRQLPGVGRYTAAAIASIAFGEAAAVVDGNVRRVLTRLADVAAPIHESGTEHILWILADSLLDKKHPGDFNQAMMELGARLCTPRKPRCEECPARKWCRACAKGVQEQRPVRRMGKAVPHYEVVVAAIRKNGRYLIGKRRPGGLLGGLWEFPGGKVRRGESHERALRRESKEELGVRLKVGEPVGVVRHAYSHFKVTLHVYRCELVSGTPHPHSHTELKWVHAGHFHRYAFPKANHKFLGLL